MTPLDTKKTMQSTHSRHLSLQGLAPLLLPYVPFIPPLHTPPGHPGLLLSLQHPSQMPSSGFSFLYLYSFLFPGWPCPSCLQSSLLPSFHLCLWPKVLTPLPVYYLNSSPITLFFLSFFLFFFCTTSFFFKALLPEDIFYLFAPFWNASSLSWWSLVYSWLYQNADKCKGAVKQGQSSKSCSWTYQNITIC